MSPERAKRESELDPSKTRLVQRTERDFSLDFELPKEGSMVVRHQDQPRAHEILAEVVDLLRSDPNQEVNEEKIELAGVRDAARRTEFFLRLVQGVGEHKFEDVKAVKASRFQKPGGAEANGDGPDETEDLDEGAEPDSKEISTEEAAFIAQVKEIALKGEGILYTPQYAQLAEHGFFVRAIVWTAIEQKTDGPHVEFEAAFDNAQDGTGFTYTVRGIYVRKADGEHKKAKSNLPQTEKTRLLRLVEQAARGALEHVVEATAKPSDEPEAVKDAS